MDQKNPVQKIFKGITKILNIKQNFKWITRIQNQNISIFPNFQKDYKNANFQED